MSRRNRIMNSSSSSEGSNDSSEEEYHPKKAARRSSQSTRPRANILSQQSTSSQDATDNTQLSTQCQELSQDEFSRNAGLIANYFLGADCKKIPVKRADLGKVVGKQHVRILPQLLEEASALLQKICGYKIFELQKKKNSYILVNTLAPQVNDSGSGPLNAPESDDTEDDREDGGNTNRLEDDGDERQGLLFLILTVVFMMGDVVEEVTLVSFLKCLGVYVDNKDPHSVFGNCKKLLEDYVKQCYLEVTVMKDMEPPIRQYSWGERAHLQVCKRGVLEHVCRVYGGGLRPENWIDQWSKVVGSNGASSSSVGSSVEEISLDEQPRAASKHSRAK